MNIDDSGNNGEKKPLPKITEKDKDAFLHVTLKIIGQLTRPRAVVCIKQEGLDTFPNEEKPVFAWDNSKKQWAVTLLAPKQKIVTLNKRIIGA